MKISKIKSLTVILLTLMSIFLVAPNFVKIQNPILPSKTVNLGLDLRGGSHLLLNVDFESYLNDMVQLTANSLKKSLRNSNIGYKNFQIKGNVVLFTLRQEEDASKIANLLRDVDSNLSYSINESLVTVYHSEYVINQLQDRVVDQSIEIVRMRVDSNGTKEPTIQRQGVLNILLQVPGEDNPNELKRILGKMAKLTFHKVDNNVTSIDLKNDKAPSGSKILQSNEGGLVAVKTKSIISGDHLTNAQVQFQEGKAVVQFELNNLGARKFGDFTKNNRGARLAIVLDGKVLSAPSINEPIMGGSGVISGNFTVDSANELALMLRAGALPAPLKIIEERSIGPNLGADSIESGKIAASVGLVLVMVFMILAYGILGIFANVTLLISLLYIFAALTMLQATLTLPGIAGIILTIGMAVDANILIYERIREEIEKGNSNLYAVKIGFESAFRTIMDSNLTTLIAAFLLYSFGVGAIKGFAVTLTIGVIASMYCALVITKLMIDIWLLYFKPKKILY